jgi:hypothetical protein
VVRLGCRKSQTGADILTLEIGKIREYFGLANTSREEIEDILNPDPHAADARATAALVRIKRNAIHDDNLVFVPRTVKRPRVFKITSRGALARSK